MDATTLLIVVVGMVAVVWFIYALGKGFQDIGMGFDKLFNFGDVGKGLGDSFGNFGKGLGDWANGVGQALSGIGIVLPSQIKPTIKLASGKDMAIEDYNKTMDVLGVLSGGTTYQTTDIFNKPVTQTTYGIAETPEQQSIIQKAVESGLLTPEEQKFLTDQSYQNQIIAKEHEEDIVPLQDAYKIYAGTMTEVKAIQTGEVVATPEEVQSKLNLARVQFKEFQQASMWGY